MRYLTCKFKWYLMPTILLLSRLSDLSEHVFHYPDFEFGPRSLSSRYTTTPSNTPFRLRLDNTSLDSRQLPTASSWPRQEIGFGEVP